MIFRRHDFGLLFSGVGDPQGYRAHSKYFKSNKISGSPRFAIMLGLRMMLRWWWWWCFCFAFLNCCALSRRLCKFSGIKFLARITAKEQVCFKVGVIGNSFSWNRTAVWIYNTVADYTYSFIGRVTLIDLRRPLTTKSLLSILLGFLALLVHGGILNASSSSLPTVDLSYAVH